MKSVWSALAMALAPAHVAAQTIAATAAPAQIPAPRPIADFATLPFIESPQLSPDGTKIAAKLAVEGVQYFAVLSLYEKKQLAVVGLGANDLIDWTWVNNDWLALRVGREDQNTGNPIYLTRIAGVSADGKTIHPVGNKEGGQSADIIWVAHDGTPHLLMALQTSIFLGDAFWPDVYDVDVSTGRYRQVVDGQSGVMNWAADPSGAVRLGYGYDDDTRSARLLYRPGPKGSFKIVDRANFRKDERLTFPLILQDRVLTIAQPDGIDAVYELDVSTMRLGQKIWGTAGYDVDSIGINPLTGTLEGIHYTTDRSHVHWLDPKLAEVQELLDKAVGGRSAAIVSMSADRQTMLVQVGNSDQPGGYYVYNSAEGGSMKRVAWVNERIKGATLSPVSSYHYKARDGMSIEAILTLPKGREAKNLPLILMPHGGPAARDTASYDWWAQFLADRGYAVVQPNYRGSTGYGDAFLKAGEGEWGLKMQDDLNDAVDDLAKRGIADAKRVCIAGASYGGYAAMRAAQRDGARFRCAVSYAGVSDLSGMIRYNSQFLTANGTADYLKKQAPDLRGVSPLNFPEQFSTPILIMHGKVDRRVPFWQSQKMANRLKDAGKSYEFVVQPEGDHFFSREADRLQFLQVLEAFLKKHNPA